MDSLAKAMSSAKALNRFEQRAAAMEAENNYNVGKVAIPKSYARGAAVAGGAALAGALARKAYNMATQKKPRRRRKRAAIGGIRGQGAYFTDGGALLGAGLGAGFGSLGGGVGAFGGAGLGYQLGSSAGSLIDQLTGMGEYSIKANSILAKVDEGVQIPSFGNLTNATIVQHRSFVQDIVTPANPLVFNVQQFRINPANQQLFPWLSTLANSFEQYQILGMVFQYKSLSSDSATTLALGSVTMGTKYEANDPPFRNKIEMENAQYTCSGKPCDTFIHALECDPTVMSDPIKYNLQSGIYPIGKDPRGYDVGTFEIATTGLPSTAGEILGELWITYEVALFRPLLNTISASDRYTITAPTSPNTLIGPAATVRLPDAGSTLGTTVVGSNLNFPSGLTRGTYNVRLAYQGGATALTNTLAPTFVNCARSPALDTYFVSAGATSSYQIWDAIIIVTAAGASIAFGAGTPTLPTAINRATLLVNQIPDNWNIV